MTNQNFCPYCAAVILPDASQCKNCGATLERIIDHELPKQTILFNGRFEILHTIGRGGFGIAYLAQEVKTNQQVVVKELFPDQLVIRIADRNVVAIKGAELEFQQSLKHSEREATIASQLKHPSASKIIETWRENGTSYTAMEYIRGQTLEQRLVEKTLSEPEVIDCMTQILEVLQELHGKGLLHRDIKPANIILGTSRVELIDYGSVTSFRKGERIKLTTRLVTPEYAPLEQFASETELSPATDLYALGATMFEAMTGKPPPAALERANGAKLPSISGFSGGTAWLLTGLIEKMLEMKVTNRPKSASSVLEMLRSLEHSVSRVQPSSVTMPQKPLVTRAPTKRRPVWEWVALVGLIYFLELFIFQLGITQWQRNSPEVNSDYIVSNFRPRTIQTSKPDVLSDIRVYLVPNWIENSKEPNFFAILNFFNTDNLPFVYHKNSDIKNYSMEIFNLDMEKIFTLSPKLYSGSGIDIDLVNTALKLGKYKIVVTVYENNRKTRTIAMEYDLKSNLTRFESIKNLKGRYNLLNQRIEFIWDSILNDGTLMIKYSKRDSITMREIRDLRLHDKNFQYQMNSSDLQNDSSLDFYIANTASLFLTNPADSSQIAFAQISICGSTLVNLKMHPHVFMPLKTGCY